MSADNLAVSMTHLPTGSVQSLSSFNFSHRMNGVAWVDFITQTPHAWHDGDLATFLFPEKDATSNYARTMRGVERQRLFETDKVTIYDYATVLKQITLDFDRNHYVGEDPLMAIKDMVETADVFGMIDTSLLHGTSPAKRITWEDNVASDHEFAYDVITRTLAKFYDDSNDGYILPYAMWFESNQIIIDKWQDIEDATNYPALADIAFTETLRMRYREDNDSVVNRVTCIGLDGAAVTVIDADKNSEYSGSGSLKDFRPKGDKIFFDSANTDELRQKAIDQIVLNKDVRGEYSIELPDHYGITLNTILNVTGGEWGMDGRFLVTAIDIDSSMRVRVTISGKRLSIVDVL